MSRRAVVPLLAAAAFAASCRSFDPDSFDERLRAATFDAYVQTIDTQFGGLSAAGVTAEELSARYRERAVVADSLAGFYGELRAMLADLDDPHAALQVSPRFWSGPVAEPEWVQFVRLDGAVWIGMPEASVRTPEELDSEIDRWLRPLGVENAAELTPSGIAQLLRASAAFPVARLFRGVTTTPGHSQNPRAKPLRWMELHAIDGRIVETPHDAELLVRGALGSVLYLDVTLREYGPDSSERDRARRTTLALIRNAGVFENEQTVGGIRRRLSPRELADQVDPDSTRLETAHLGRTPSAANAALRRMRRRSAFRRGTRVELDGEEPEAFGLQAWRLRTPAGARAGYLRIGSFRSALNEADDPEHLTLYDPLLEVMAAFHGIDHWIIDVTQNPGGSWQEAGLFVSYFLTEEDKFVPHEVRSIKLGGNLFFRTHTIETHRLTRVDVEPVTAKTVHVLVDQDTASAGEIIASALRGKAGAILVGERTAGAEYSTAEFEAPDGSVLRIGLSGGMIDPYESFQGRGLEVDIKVEPKFEDGFPKDLEIWRAVFRFSALRAALLDIDATVAENR